MSKDREIKTEENNEETVDWESRLKEKKHFLRARNILQGFNESMA